MRNVPLSCFLPEGNPGLCHTWCGFLCGGWIASFWQPAWGACLLVRIWCGFSPKLSARAPLFGGSSPISRRIRNVLTGYQRKTRMKKLGYFWNRYPLVNSQLDPENHPFWVVSLVFQPLSATAVGLRPPAAVALLQGAEEAIDQQPHCVSKDLGMDQHACCLGDFEEPVVQFFFLTASRICPFFTLGTNLVMVRNSISHFGACTSGQRFRSLMSSPQKWQSSGTITICFNIWRQAPSWPVPSPSPSSINSSVRVSHRTNPIWCTSSHGLPFEKRWKRYLWIFI